MSRWPCRALFLLVLSVCIPAFAGRLADLPWHSKVPQSLSLAARHVLEREAATAMDKTNEQGKKYVRAYPSFLFEPAGQDRVTAYMAVQNCLADKMVTELWRYTIAKKGLEGEVEKKEKIGEDASALHIMVEQVNKARPLKPFVFQHDLLTLKVDAGSYVLGFRGPKPDTIVIAGNAHLQVKPLNDYERMFFTRRLEHESVDTDVTEIRISFHEDDPQFLKVTGADPAAASAPAGEFESGLKDGIEEESRIIKGREFTPYVYGDLLWPEFQGMFTLSMKSKDYGWLVYSFNPTAPTQISFYRQVPQLAGSSALNPYEDQDITRYTAPETRALPATTREHRREFRQTDAYMFDAMFDIDPNTFTARARIGLNLLIDTDHLQFFLAGSPRVEYVRLDGQDLVFVPYPNVASLTYGFEETTNRFRVRLPHEFKKGSRITLDVAFQSVSGKGSAFQRIVNAITGDYWEISRTGFLPFLTVITDPAYLHFVLRTGSDFDHVTVGTKLSEEVDRDYRYTEWGANRGFNFATMMIGRYFEPIEMTVDNIKVAGFMNRRFFGLRQQIDNGTVQLPPDVQIPEPTRGDMEFQVQQAAAAAKAYGQWFATPYPFRDLKLVSSPLMGMSAQSPTSIVYIGEFVFWPDQAISQFFRGMDPAWAHSVTAHETAHQWFGGMVSNINSDHYWFVESLAEVSSAFFRKAIDDKTGLKSTIDYWRTHAFANDWHKAVIDDTTRGEPRMNDVLLRYTKGPYLLWSLQEYYGEQKLMQYLRNIIRVHQGDLIATADLQRVAEQTFGEPMGWFFDQYVRDVGIPQVLYHFEAPRPAEDGKGWVIDAKFRQEILLKGAAVPGKVFKHLLVPLTVDTETGPEKQKVFLDSAEQDIKIRFESKPKGAPKVNQNNYCYLMTKEM